MAGALQAEQLALRPALQPLLAALAATPFAAPAAARATAPRAACRSTRRARSDMGACRASDGRPLDAPQAPSGLVGQRPRACGWAPGPGAPWRPPPPRPPPGDPPPGQPPPQPGGAASYAAAPGAGRAEAGAGPVSAGPPGGGPPAGGNRAAAGLLRARLRAASQGLSGGGTPPDPDPDPASEAAAAAALPVRKRALGDGGGGGGAKRARQDPARAGSGAVACSGAPADSHGGCSAAEVGEAGGTDGEAPNASEHAPACLQVCLSYMVYCGTASEQSGALRLAEIDTQSFPQCPGKVVSVSKLLQALTAAPRGERSPLIWGWAAQSPSCSAKQTDSSPGQAPQSSWVHEPDTLMCGRRWRRPQAAARTWRSWAQAAQSRASTAARARCTCARRPARGSCWRRARAPGASSCASTAAAVLFSRWVPAVVFFHAPGYDGMACRVLCRRRWRVGVEL